MRLLRKRRAPAFSEIVEAARADGYLAGPVWPAYEPLDPHRPGDMGDLLIDLKDHRKRTRHQGSDDARAWLDVHFWALGLVLERLSERLQAAR